MNSKDSPLVWHLPAILWLAWQLISLPTNFFPLGNGGTYMCSILKQNQLLIYKEYISLYKPVVYKCPFEHDSHYCLILPVSIEVMLIAQLEQHAA